MGSSELSMILPRVLIVSRRTVRKNKFVDFVGKLLYICENNFMHDLCYKEKNTYKVLFLLFFIVEIIGELFFLLFYEKTLFSFFLRACFL